ncbi:MAG TPA: redoxin family protein [Phycisphaerae bacterium]|nr:redoxin family protein [Phycisphaerae bacterium]HRW51678.1 redoxin family protein [Phycisphaerae bacterium]
MKKALALAFIVGLIASPKAMAELKVGDDAPNIFIKEWAKGEAFDLTKAKAKDVIVVEFWATWCPPCKASIPHMSEMQDHFKSKGVTFIGVTDENKEIVSKFLKNGWDEKMRYRVAIDNENKTSDAWMKASNQRGIPTAFVVQGGKLKWIGHPMDELGLTVAKLAGDEEYARKEEEKKKQQEKIQQLLEKFEAAAKGEEWDKCIGILDDALKVDPKDFRLLITKYMMLAMELKKPTEAAAAGRQLVDNVEDAEALNMFAWRLLTSEEFEGSRDLTLAKDAATKALRLCNEKDASILDTYARALADTGDLKGAVHWQSKAVELAEEGRMKDELQKNLDDYRKRLEEKA